VEITGAEACQADTAKSGFGLVVRTSVFGWQTFPDLRLIYG